MKEKVDFSDCSENVVALVLAILFYRKDALKVIQNLFNDFKIRIWSRVHGSHVYGIVFDKKRHRCFFGGRGTGGFDPLGNILSWLTDFRIISGFDGVHNGFQYYGNIQFDKCKKYLEDFLKIVLFGHSQYAGVCQYLARLCCENLNIDNKKISGHLFAVPPAYNEKGVLKCRKHIDGGKLDLNLYQIDGDAIASDTLRNKKSCLLNGVDVKEAIKLNRPITQDVLIVDDFLCHSGRQYIAMMIIYLINNYIGTFKDLQLLSKVHDLAIN